MLQPLSEEGRSIQSSPGAVLAWEQVTQDG